MKRRSTTTKTIEKVEREIIRASDLRNMVINQPEGHRAILMQIMIALVEGRMTVQAANAAAGISCEVHKSVKLQAENVAFVQDNIRIIDGQVTRIDEDENDDVA